MKLLIIKVLGKSKNNLTYFILTHGSWMKTFFYLTELQLAFLVKLVTKEKFEDKKKTYHEETPQSPKQGIPELPVQVLTNEDNNAEVGVEPITDEKRRKDQEPGSLGWQNFFFNLEHQKHGEYGEGEKPDPDFKHRNPKPAQQLFLTEKHF